MFTEVVSYDAAILTRVVLPEEPTMSREAAVAVLKLGFSALDKQRMEALAERARRGLLTEEEREEADSYERVSSLIGLLKSKARVSLNRQSDGN